MSVAIQATTTNASNETDESANLSAAATAILQKARDAAASDNLDYAGGVSPVDAWTLFSEGAAVLVDVRSGEERKFVGHVPDTLHVAWATGTSLTRNPRFTRELEAKVKKDQVVLLLCRSGKRSAAAAQAATKAGFTQAFNVLEGFEGEIDAQQQRGGLGGWRFHSLPWTQD
ncbi:MAG: Rhodanese-related sulfurtransferase [Verrucomicrobiaceae bacterium]|nr:Rhodanese-related sulfurtransferase [Verrucomicrobiaceae bacterium]